MIAWTATASPAVERSTAVASVQPLPTFIAFSSGSPLTGYSLGHIVSLLTREPSKVVARHSATHGAFGQGGSNSKSGRNSPTNCDAFDGPEGKRRPRAISGPGRVHAVICTSLSVAAPNSHANVRIVPSPSFPIV